MYVDCLGDSAPVISVEIITVGLWLNSTMILELSEAVRIIAGSSHESI